MPEEGFLRRWARVKATGAEVAIEAPPPAAPPAPVAAAAPPALHTPVQGEAAQPLPTLVDAAQLTSDSDFSAFVSPHVGQDVRRLALKKLFADPHFNVLDRLDMYMDDYNKPDPVSAAMLAALDHARGTLRRPEEVQAELARLRAQDAPVETADAALAAADDALDAPGAAEESTAPAEAPDAAGDDPQQQAPAAIEADLLPPTAEHDREVISDVIALTPVRAHNAQAGV
jgi:hypothetical protein